MVLRGVWDENRQSDLATLHSSGGFGFPATRASRIPARKCGPGTNVSHPSPCLFFATTRAAGSGSTQRTTPKVSRNELTGSGSGTFYSGLFELPELT